MDPKQQTSKVLLFFAWIFTLQYMCAAMTCPNLQCDFSRDLCGWTATNGAFGSTFQWDRGTQGSNGFARLDTSNKIGESSELQSPMLDPQPGQTCQLTFRYYLGGSGEGPCGLSVIMRSKNGGDTTLTPIRQATGTSLSFTNHPPIPFDCQSGSQYQIIFNGSVITGSGRDCGFDTQIAVDDIACTATATTTTTTTTTTTKPTTTTTTTTPRPTTTTAIPTPILPVYTTQLTPTVPGPEETSTCVECTTDETASSLSAGPTAGIAIAGVAVVAVVVIIVVVVVVVKRRGSGAGKQGGPEQHVYVNTEFQEDSVTTTDHHNRDHHEDSHLGNDNDVSEPPYLEILPGDAIHVQTYQNASNNIYEPLANEDVGLSNPYNVLTNESAPNTYEAFSSRADSHVYKTLTNQKRDADGYEWPVARAKL